VVRIVAFLCFSLSTASLFVRYSLRTVCLAGDSVEVDGHTVLSYDVKI